MDHLDNSRSSDPKNKSKDKIDAERGFVPMIPVDLKGSIISNSDPKRVENDPISPLRIKEAKKYSQTNINEISAINNPTAPDTSMNTTDHLILGKLQTAGHIPNSNSATKSPLL